MTTVKAHTRKTKKGKTAKVRSHTRRTRIIPQPMWGEMMKYYSDVRRRTPKDLVAKLVAGKKEGTFWRYGHPITFKVLEEFEDMWVVDAVDVSRSGCEAGGLWYVSKRNPNQSVFD